MKLADMLDKELLAKHLMMGVVSVMKHPNHPELSIYNYTHVAQHENMWDNVTEQCRGLIVNNQTDEVLARPFRKFFNLNTNFRSETWENNLPLEAPSVLEKLDGSLGILYDLEGDSFIATRGSFWSDQARWATNWLTLHEMSGQIKGWPEGYTPLFEIIYKENRIVVDYGDFEGLVLLGLVRIFDGAELPPHEVCKIGLQNGLRVAKTSDLRSVGECKSYQVTNTEGFVLQYWSKGKTAPLRIKVKTEEYTRLHKIITGMNAKGIWEHLSQGYDSDAIWANTTPQFAEWAIGYIRMFKNMYKELETNALLAFGEIYAHVSEVRSASERSSNSGMDARALRKLYAMAIQEKPARYHPILFSILKGDGYKAQIWKQLEPKITGKEVYIRDADSFNGI